MILTRQGSIYSWGQNDFGQLGHGDHKNRTTPEKVENLNGRKVTQIAVGHEFSIALGLTLSQKEYKKIINKTKVLSQNKQGLTTRKVSKPKTNQVSMLKRSKSL